MLNNKIDIYIYRYFSVVLLYADNRALNIMLKVEITYIVENNGELGSLYLIVGWFVANILYHMRTYIERIHIRVWRNYGANEISYLNKLIYFMVDLHDKDRIWVLPVEIGGDFWVWQSKELRIRNIRLDCPRCKYFGGIAVFVKRIWYYLLL